MARVLCGLLILGLAACGGGASTEKRALIWARSADSSTLDPAEIDEAGPKDTLKAISAARTAFDEGPWPHTPAVERGELLGRVADLLARDRSEVARAESLDTGKRLVESGYDVDDVVAVFRHYARIASEDAGRVIDTGRAEAHREQLHLTVRDRRLPHLHLDLLVEVCGWPSRPT